MKILFFILAFIFSSAISSAQQNHFIYLQTDNKQPFYVTINDIVYSSSGNGYAIIPRLQKGAYDVQIGFPKDKWPEQTIKLQVNEDAGFALKNFDEKGWGLFNLQTLDLLMAGNKSTEPSLSKPETDQPTTNDNAFASTLAGVVNTPDLAKKLPEPTKEIPVAIEDPKQPAASVEPPATEVLVAPVSVVENTAVPSTVVRTASIITKISEASDYAGFAFRYTDASAKGTDTVQVFIPDSNPDRNNKKPEAMQVASTNPSVEQATAAPIVSKAQDPVLAVTPTEPVDKRFLDIDLSNPNAVPPVQKEVEVVKEPTVEKIPAEEKEATVKRKRKKDQKKQLSTDEIPEDKPVVSLNSNCKKLATDEDFFKTRKRMAAAPNAEAMIHAAERRFKSACYTTEQLKNLSVLFLKDETRYNFYDAAYPFVSDSENFGNLQPTLTDEYYVNRFKAMIR